MPADAHFSPVAFSGGYEQSIIGLVNGTFEVAATHWRNEESGNVQTMEKKGLIPKGSARIIWKSPVIPNTPVMMLTTLPQELQDAFRTALFAFPTKDPARRSRPTPTARRAATSRPSTKTISI